MGKLNKSSFNKINYVVFFAAFLLFTIVSYFINQLQYHNLSYHLLGLFIFLLAFIVLFIRKKGVGMLFCFFVLLIPTNYVLFRAFGPSQAKPLVFLLTGTIFEIIYWLSQSKLKNILLINGLSGAGSAATGAVVGFLQMLPHFKENFDSCIVPFCGYGSYQEAFKVIIVTNFGKYFVHFLFVGMISALLAYFLFQSLPISVKIRSFK